MFHVDVYFPRRCALLVRVVQDRNEETISFLEKSKCCEEPRIVKAELLPVIL